MLKIKLQRFAGPTVGDDGSMTFNTDDLPDEFRSLFLVDDPLDEEGNPIPSNTPPAQPPAEPPAEPPAPPVEPPAQPPQEPQPPEPPAQPPQPQEPPAKPVQTPEDNARFAELRRQQQIDERANQLAQERLQQSEEYQLAQWLAKQSGLSVADVRKQMQEQALKNEAQQRGVPVEVLREVQEAKQAQEQLRQELQVLRFQAWQSRVDAEQAQLKSKYSFLSNEDWMAAKNHMLTGLKNPEIPLEQSVFSLFGSTLFDKQREAIRQEVLADMGGRKPSALPPQGARPTNDAPVLSDDEKIIAREFGMTEAEYAKWKNQS